MPTKQEVEKELESKLSDGERQLDKLKAKLSEAGEDASDEMRDAVAAAERTLKKGRAKLAELGEISEDKFDEAWASSKESWHAAIRDMESGWESLSNKVKGFFA